MDWQGNGEVNEVEISESVSMVKATETSELGSGIQARHHQAVYKEG